MYADLNPFQRNISRARAKIDHKIDPKFLDFTLSNEFFLSWF